MEIELLQSFLGWITMPAGKLLLELGARHNLLNWVAVVTEIKPVVIQFVSEGRLSSSRIQLSDSSTKQTSAELNGFLQHNDDDDISRPVAGVEPFSDVLQ